MTQTATAVKPYTPTLDSRISDALASTEHLSSDFLGALYDELDIAVGVANETARECRAKSIDPLCRDAIAERGKAEDQEFVSTRLCNAATPLREKYQKVLAREARERWQADTAELKLRIATLSKELMDVYPRAVAELTALFLRVESANREAARFNSTAPTGCGLSGIDDAKRILERVRLPAPAGGSAPDSWPLPPAVPIGVMLHDMARSMMIGARPPTEDERAAESERVIAHARQMETGRVRLGDEAAARARANEAEQRRLAAGG
jgi:hypothetical protein